MTAVQSSFEVPWGNERSEITNENSGSLTPPAATVSPAPLVTFQSEILLQARSVTVV